MNESIYLEVSASGFVGCDDWIEAAVLQYSCHMVSDIFLFLVHL